MTDFEVFAFWAVIGAGVWWVLKAVLWFTAAKERDYAAQNRMGDRYD